jgi:hypothetical protein
MSKRASSGQNVQQNIKIGTIRSRGPVSVSQSVQQFALPESSAEFVSTLQDLAKKLVSLSAQHPDAPNIKDACTEIQSAYDEAKKRSPNSSKILRALLAAKGFLELAGETVAPLLPLAKTVADLAKLVPTLFGK